MTSVKSTLNIKIDKSVKEIASQLLGSMGLDHTTAIDMYYRQIITERRIPFQPTSGLSLDEQIMAAIKIKNIPEVTLETDKNGDVFIDKDRHHELHD